MSSESNKSYSDRLHAVIPGGAHTYSRGDDQFPDNAPSIIERGKGAYVWDPQGNRYLDYGMGLRSVTVGYCDPQINQAVVAQLEKGNNFTRPGVLELEAAELMVALAPGSEMVKFAKNGSNATTAALKIARAYTGRKYACIPRQHPFFSFDDWFIGTTALKRGIPEEHYATTLLFDFNDIGSLEALFQQYPDQIAAVMLEPITTISPCPADRSCLSNSECQKVKCNNCKPNFLEQVQTLCRKSGALFILDEMISGFRFHLNGAQAFFGVEPDMTTFGKGMANGFSLAAITGRRELMQLGSITEDGMERTFLLSTTHGAEMTSLAAFVETIKVYKERKVIEHFWDYGTKLFNGINKISSKLGLKDNFFMEGGSILMNYSARDSEGKVSMSFRTLFAREMLKNGILMPYVSISRSHEEPELLHTLKAAEEALQVYKKALAEGIDKYLPCRPIRPVFRKFN